MQDVKTILKSYIPTLRYAEKCFREYDMARAVSVRSPKMDGMPRSGNVTGLEMQVAIIEQKYRKAEKAREKASRIVDMVYDMIESLDDADQKAVIKLRYVFGDSWDSIATSMEMKERTVYYIHGKALAQIRKNCSNLQF